MTTSCTQEQAYSIRLRWHSVWWLPSSGLEQEHLPSVAEAAISLLVDPSPRVRFQALQLTGRLSDLYPVDFQVRLSYFHSIHLIGTVVVMPELLPIAQQIFNFCVMPVPWQHPSGLVSCTPNRVFVVGRVYTTRRWSPRCADWCPDPRSLSASAGTRQQPSSTSSTRKTSPREPSPRTWTLFFRPSARA